MNNITLISFDIGNTLIQLHNNDGFCSKFSIKTGVGIEFLRPLFNEYFLTKNYSLQFAVKKVCSIIGYKYPQKIINEFSSVPTKLFEDVIPTLKQLKCAGMTMIAISNCTPWEANDIEELGLKAYIQEVFYSFAIGVAKPDINLFLYVQKKIGVLPKNILHVGDSYTADVKGSIEAGWRVVLLDRNKSYSGDKNQIGFSVIRSLNELLNLV